MLSYLESKYVIFKYLSFSDKFCPITNLDLIESVSFSDTVYSPIEIKLIDGTYIRYKGNFVIEYEWKK